MTVSSQDMFHMRASGILLPVFSLPSPYGIGGLGAAARGWIDRLAAAGQTYWQVLPVNPTAYGDSPYQSTSAYAGNPYFIDLDELVAAGFLTREEANQERVEPSDTIDYGRLWERRYAVLMRAFRASGVYAPSARNPIAEKIADWRETNRAWAEDYAQFMTLKNAFGNRAWREWPDWAKLRRGEEWERFVAEQTIDGESASEAISFYLFLGFEFDREWGAMRAYANARGIKIIGDMPIYCAFDSADVWAHPEIIALENGEAKFVAGVPPDYFSDKGQIWGNPLYDWDAQRENGYAWWIGRTQRNFALFDGVRIDHFRGFSAYFAVPAKDADAKRGHWEKGPGAELFLTLESALGELPIIAEDLGIIDDGVRALLRATGLPGMKVLQFAFDGNPENEYLPARHIRNCVVYTGTHDNATLREWAGGLTAETRRYIRAALGGAQNASIPRLILRAACDSAADTVILCLQDILGYGAEARLNTPSTTYGNWRWRLTELPSDAVCRELRKRTRESGRLRT